MFNNFGVEYSSDYILIVSDCRNEDFIVIALIDDFPKMKRFHTWYNPIDNEEIENTIIELLDSNIYDIDYEIEQYRCSRLYRDLEENERINNE